MKLKQTAERWWKDLILERDSDWFIIMLAVQDTFWASLDGLENVGKAPQTDAFSTCPLPRFADVVFLQFSLSETVRLGF